MGGRGVMSPYWGSTIGGEVCYNACGYVVGVGGTWSVRGRGIECRVVGVIK